MGLTYYNLTHDNRFQPEGGYLDPERRYRLTAGAEKFKDGVEEGAIFRVHKIKDSHIAGMPVYKVFVSNGDARSQRICWWWVVEGPVELEDAGPRQH